MHMTSVGVEKGRRSLKQAMPKDQPCQLFSYETQPTCHHFHSLLMTWLISTRSGIHIIHIFPQEVYMLRLRGIDYISAFRMAEQAPTGTMGHHQDQHITTEPLTSHIYITKSATYIHSRNLSSLSKGSSKLLPLA